MMRITPDHNSARLAATMAQIDAGAGHGVIELYDVVQPTVLGGAPSGPPCATITLTKPCGTIDGGYLVLAQEDVAGDMIDTSSSGGVTWALLRNGGGVIVADGTVTDANGDGDFKLAGSSGTSLFAGGYVLLGDCRLG